MQEAQPSKFTDSIARKILDSRREVTILFSDIEYSTLHWDQLGDVDGRLMVDQHNRLVFPVIKKFRGKVIKTIGDAVMASFYQPGNAVKAAIGIQQILNRTRFQDEKFCCKVRIGIHTGTGLVERWDVFGDVVNVAARVESQTLGGEILVTGSTASKLGNGEFELVEQEGFVPRGKQELLTTYQCVWEAYPLLVGDIQLSSFLPISKRDRLDILVFVCATVGIFYFLYLKYFRYVLGDHESIALVLLNPELILRASPAVPAGLSIVIVLLGILLFNMRTVPLTLLRFLKGGFGFCIGFFVVFLMTLYLPVSNIKYMNAPLYESKHMFVEIQRKNTPLHEKPSVASPVVRKVDSGTLLLLTDLKEQDVVTWNNVLIAQGLHAWVQRVRPAKVGVPEKRITVTNKFYFRAQDCYALLAGMVGFIWGFISFRIRPM